MAGVFFVWKFGTSTWLALSMIVGETTMFAAAVVWWWWAMHTMTTLVKQWDATKNNVSDVLKDIKEIKNIVNETIEKDK